MSTPNPATYLSALLEGHGLSCAVEGDWVLPDARLPALRAVWHPGPQLGRLDVQTLLRDQLVVEESFAGFGPGEDGLRDGVESFVRSSFHVMLAALWDTNDPEQVTTQAWVVNGRHYTAYIGNISTRASERAEAYIPGGLSAAVSAAIAAEPLSGDCHWFRVFFANVSGDFTFEALKDNQVWEAGVRSLKDVGWEAREGYYSVRLFVMLCAGSQGSATGQQPGKGLAGWIGRWWQQRSAR